MKQIQLASVLFLLLFYPLICLASWENEGTLKVAVMDIVSRVENESIDAATISDMLQAHFVEKKKFKIVERAMLNKILEEKKLYMLGLTDTDASKVGAMAGADKIITGSISRMADRYVILVKGIDTRSGVVEVSDQELISNVDDMPNAIKMIADRVMRKACGESIEVSSLPTRKGKIVFDERFQNNQNGWSIGDWDAAGASVTDGQYVIRMKSQAPIFRSKIDVVVDQGADFNVEATVVKLKGSDENLSYYGIIFGKDFENMYEFLVHPNGKCMIRYLHNGNTTFIQPSASSAYVQRGNAENTLRIQRVGEYLKFYLNGQFVNQDLPKSPIPNAFLIGYEVWRTEREKLVIAGKQITISQSEPVSQLSTRESAEAGRSSAGVIDLPPPGGSFTAWMAGAEFGKEMDKHWKDGYYPAAVEGRNHDGRSEFRAVLQPFPKKVWWFYWWYDQLGSSYEEHRKKMSAEGFKEIHLQVFTDRDGMRKYQTCWIKYGS